MTRTSNVLTAHTFVHDDLPICGSNSEESTRLDDALAWSDRDVLEAAYFLRDRGISWLDGTAILGGPKERLREIIVNGDNHFGLKFRSTARVGYHAFVGGPPTLFYCGRVTTVVYEGGVARYTSPIEALEHYRTLLPAVRPPATPTPTPTPIGTDAQYVALGVETMKARIAFKVANVDYRRLLAEFEAATRLRLGPNVSDAEIRAALKAVLNQEKMRGQKRG